MLGTMLFSAPLPVFESVVASAAEVVPDGVLGKLSAGASEAADAVPVPLSVAVCGELASLSATESVAEKLAAEAGEKVT
jgi:hypothetical protein